MSSFWKHCRGLVLGAGMLTTFGLTGCQVEIGGQTLPSPYYIYDDVQYFPAGPEFILSNEAAAMEAQRQALAAPQPGGGGGNGGVVEQGQKPGFAPLR